MLLLKALICMMNILVENYEQWAIFQHIDTCE